MNISPNDVTIIIPHLGATAKQQFAFQQCFASLEKTVPDMRKLLAVNGKDKYYDRIGDIKVFEQGQCKAVNAAVATVNTPWIFVTNDDMIYSKGWFERLTSDEGILENGCISPTLVEPQDGAPPFIKHFAGGAGGDFDVKNWEGFAQDYYEHTYGIEEGFNLPFLIKKELWDLIGGYDVAYDPWGSNGDSDLQAKIHLAGARTMRDRNTIVYHFSQTSGTFHPDQRPYWQKNWDYFIEKWGFERQSDDQKIWYSKDLIDYDKLKYKPKWKGIWKN